MNRQEKRKLLKRWGAVRGMLWRDILEHLPKEQQERLYLYESLLICTHVVTHSGATERMDEAAWWEQLARGVQQAELLTAQA